MSKPSRLTADIAHIAEPIGYDPDTETYRAFFDAPPESVIMAITAVVARATETDPTAINPLYSAIDPDALDTLMNPGSDPQPDSNIHVTFTLEGHEVTVHSHGMIRVTPKA